MLCLYYCRFGRHRKGGEERPDVPKPAVDDVSRQQQVEFLRAKQEEIDKQRAKQREEQEKYGWRQFLETNLSSVSGSSPERR